MGAEYHGYVSDITCSVRSKPYPYTSLTVLYINTYTILTLLYVII